MRRIAAVFLRERSFCYQWVSLDFDIDFGSLFELHLSTIFIAQAVPNPDPAIEVIGSLDGDLGFFGLAGAGMRMDKFFNFSYQRSSCLGRFRRHGHAIRETPQEEVKGGRGGESKI